MVDACGIESGGSSFAVTPNIFITNEHVIGPDMTPTLISEMVTPWKVLSLGR